MTKGEILQDDYRRIYDELCRIEPWKSITPRYEMTYLILKVLNDLLEKEINRAN